MSDNITFMTGNREQIPCSGTFKCKSINTHIFRETNMAYFT